MSQFVKIGTKWYHKTTFHNFNSNKEILNKFIKTSSTWNSIYNYSWKTTSDWSACTKECNTGTQDLIKKCYRNDGIEKPNYYCTQAGVAVPTVSNASTVNYKATDSQVRYRRNCNTKTCSYTYYLSADVDDYGTLYLKYSKGSSYTTAISRRSMWNKTGDNSNRGLVAYSFNVTSYKSDPIYFKFVAENSSGKSSVAFRMCKASHSKINYQDGCGTPKDSAISNGNCTYLDVATGYGCGGGSGTFWFSWVPSTMVLTKVRCCGGHCTSGARRGYSSLVNCNEPF